MQTAEQERSSSGLGLTIAQSGIEATNLVGGISAKLFVGGAHLTGKELRTLVNRRLRVVSLILADLEQVILRCLAKDPTHRFESVDAWTPHRPVAAVASGTTPKPRSGGNNSAD
jgi:hypothetical protein